MTTLRILLCLVALFIFAGLPSATAQQSLNQQMTADPGSTLELEQPPATVLYQGYLTDVHGEALVDGPYEIIFRLYDQEETGIVFWTETRTVDVTGGTFSLHLGQENSLEQVDFSIARFLSLELQGEAETAERTQLSAVPFSLLAADVKDGKVVKGINGLTDQIEIVAGEGIAVTEGDDGRLIISARTGLEGAVLDTNLRQGTAGGDDGDPQPFIVFNEVVRATPSNSFHEMGANGGLTVENTAAGAANINFIRSTGGVDQSYYRFVNRASGDFNIRDVLNNKSPFKMEFDAEENQLVLDANGNVGIGIEDPLYDLDVVDDIHASDDIISGDNVNAFDDVIAGNNGGDGDVGVFHNGLRTLFMQGGNGNGGLLQIEDETSADIGVELFMTPSNGGQIDINDDNNVAVIQSFAAADHGVSQVNQADGSALITMEQFSSSTGGSLKVKDEGGSSLINLDPDVLGTGAFAQFKGASGRTMTWDGDVGLSVAGPANTPNTVTLPTGSIERLEILDEPGIANNNASSTFSLTGSPDVLLTRTITAPTSGYIFVIGSAQFVLNSSTGIVYGVSDDCIITPSIPASLDFGMDDGPEAVSSLSGTAHGTFAVNSGNHTFCLIADDVTAGGSATVSDRQLDVIFIPTNYGTVSSNLPADGISDANQPAAAPINVQAERAQSIADNEARVQAELAQMQAQIDELKAIIAAQEAARGEAGVPTPKQYGKEGDSE